MFYEWMKECFEQYEIIMSSYARSKGRQKPILSYCSFEIQNFKSIKSLLIPMSDKGMVLLVGRNESGKTTILKAIEFFDHRNDPTDESDYKAMMYGIKDKSAPMFKNEVSTTATLKIESPLDSRDILHLLGDARSNSVYKTAVDDFVGKLNAKKEIKISRVVPFCKGKPQKIKYQFSDLGFKPGSILNNPKFMGDCAACIAALCPHIIYFEDFQDLPPEKIYVSKQSEAFNSNWYDIIEGLFYDTNPEISVQDFLGLCRDQRSSNAADGVRNRVSTNLNNKFTSKWKQLAGVAHIKETRLEYDSKGKFFHIKIVDKDDSVSYVTERSRGAIWYFGFLMKTEFRCKKMRSDTGAKPVYLIDEPASNLHSTAQQHMLKVFTTIAKNAWVVYTTHSQYLISRNNIKTAYVVKRSPSGKRLSCVRWGEYMQTHKSDSDTSYYQPIADCLMIRPHHWDMPWDKALIVEGPSDMAILRVMCEVVTGKAPDFVIYPATGADSMDSLISLNLGWGAKIKILLDSDSSGCNARRKYQKDFDLKDSQFVNLPGGVATIERLFNGEAIKTLWSECYDDGNSPDNPPTQKKCIARIFERAHDDKKMLATVRGKIGESTKEKFKVFFKETLSDFSD